MIPRVPLVNVIYSVRCSLGKDALHGQCTCVSTCMTETCLRQCLQDKLAWLADTDMRSARKFHLM